MRAFKVFIFGLLYGWFIKVAFDRIYRENEIEDLRDENVSLRDYVRSLEGWLQPKSLESKSRQSVKAATATQAAPAKDDLKAIKGIGPAIEKKLNAAGVQTFAALAGLSPGELETILGSSLRRIADEAELIAQAKKLAKRTSRL